MLWNSGPAFALNQGALQVLGTPFEGGEWTREESIHSSLANELWPQNDTNRWALFRNPLPLLERERRISRHPQRRRIGVE
jgi:hypothetical protein